MRTHLRPNTCHFCMTVQKLPQNVCKSIISAFTLCKVNDAHKQLLITRSLHVMNRHNGDDAINKSVQTPTYNLDVTIIESRWHLPTLNTMHRMSHKQTVIEINDEKKEKNARWTRGRYTQPCTSHQ